MNKFKCAVPIVLLMIGTSVFAGPAVDRARDAMSAIQGSQVTNARGLEVIAAWAVTAEPRTKPVMGEVCEDTIVGEVDGSVIIENVCSQKQVGTEPDPYTNEEMAQMWLNKMKYFNVRRLTEYRKAAKRQELKADQDALNAQIDAAEVSDL